MLGRKWKPRYAFKPLLEPTLLIEAKPEVTPEPEPMVVEEAKPESAVAEVKAEVKKKKKKKAKAQGMSTKSEYHAGFGG